MDRNPRGQMCSRDPSLRTPVMGEQDDGCVAGLAKATTRTARRGGALVEPRPNHTGPVALEGTWCHGQNVQPLSGRKGILVSGWDLLIGRDWGHTPRRCDREGRRRIEGGLPTDE